MSGTDRFGPYDGEEDGPDKSGGAPGDTGAHVPDQSRAGSGRSPRIPSPRPSVEDTGRSLPDPPRAAPEAPEAPVGASGAHEQPGTPGVPEPSAASAREVPVSVPALEHRVLKSLLGAWALAACSVEETVAVEQHLGDCGPCAEEALRLRDAVGLLHPEETLDLDPMLRARVLEGCLDRRPPRVPVPSWAQPYDAETARLDALLRDIGDAEWHAPVRLRWFEEDEAVKRRTTVAGVIAHLMTVDGLVAVALGLTDPLGEATPTDLRSPARRTEALWGASHFPTTRRVRAPWREQSHDLVRTVAFDSEKSGGLDVTYGDFALPLRDSMLDRAFECWVHAGDIAEAVDYPYEPPSPRHLNRMIDLAARMLPGALAQRRSAGRAAPPHTPGSPGRTLHLEVEGVGGGNWYIDLDAPGSGVADEGAAGRAVAHVALDGVEFCQLAAGHVAPQEAAAGQDGDREAIHDVLFAAASLSRM